MNKLLLFPQAVRFTFQQLKHNFLLFIGISLLNVGINVGGQALFAALTNNTSLKVLIDSFEFIFIEAVWKYPFFYYFTKNLPFTSEQHFWIIIIMIVSIVAILLMLLSNLGSTRIGLDLYDRGTSHFSRLLASVSCFPSYLLALIVYCIPPLIGWWLIRVNTLLWLDSIIPLHLLLIAKIILSIAIIIGIFIFCVRYSFFDLALIDTRCSVLESFRISAGLTHNFKWILFFINMVMILLCSLSFAVPFLPSILVYVSSLPRVYLYRRLQAYHQPPSRQVDALHAD